MKQHATSALKILHHLKNVHQLKNKRRRVVDEGQKDVSVDEGQRQSSQKDSEIDYTYEPSQPDNSEEFSLEEEENVDYVYHYDNDIEYVALSSPPLAASMEKEFHPNCETQIKLDSVDTAKSTKKSSKNYKKPFERVWNEDDEIFILEALLKYAENKCINPTTIDMTGFFNTFKRSFHRKVNKQQLAGKVGKLKKKFNNNIAREGEKKEDKDTLFLKPHEAKLFHLSKKIWGSIGNDVNEALHAANNMVGMHKPSHNLHFDGLENLVREHGLSMSELEEKEKVALEKKWKDYKLSEYVTFGKKAALDKELVQQALDAHK